MITDYPITSAHQVLQALALVENSKRPLVIVCDLIDGEAIAFLAEGNIKNKFQVAVIQAPYYGADKENFFEDLALFINGKFISQRENTAIPTLKLEDLGQSDAIEIGYKGTVILGSKGLKDKIKAHTDHLRKSLIESTDDVEIEAIQQRIIRFGSGAAEILIGGSTESEVMERRYRLEDALRACNNSFLEGYVPGGGLIYLHVAKALQDEFDELKESYGFKVGYTAVIKSLDCIIDTLIKNSSITLERYNIQDIKSTVKSTLMDNIGFDFKNREFRPFMDKEVLIIEPAGIAREILENASSIVSLLINTKYSV
jgi:chaperonin GroEL